MIINGNSLRIPIKDRSVHCIVTSPPYFGLRDYGLEPNAWPEIKYAPMPGLPEITVKSMMCCLGLEPDPLMFVGHIVLIFREVWRVLRDDGTAWINFGDTYAGGGRAGKDGIQKWGGIESKNQDRKYAPPIKCKRLPRGSGRWGGGNVPAPAGVKAKDLLGIPWRVAMALQADGWYFRRDIIWHKITAMPESVSDRPTTAHEYVFLFSKSPRYFYDAFAIKETAISSESKLRSHHDPDNEKYNSAPDEKWKHQFDGRTWGRVGHRNKRSVWHIATQNYAEAHFATFPEALVVDPVKAGSSEKGICSKCGAPWRRVIEKGYRAPADEKQIAKMEANGVPRQKANLYGNPTRKPELYAQNPDKTIGWQPTCECKTEKTTPAVVLDIFGGSGTVKNVSERLGRKAIVIDAKFDYCQLAKKRCENSKLPLFDE